MAETYYAITREQVLPFIKDVSTLPVDDLRTAVSGLICTRKQPEFEENLKLFNGGLQSPACILVFPRNAKDVSETVRFCARHKLSPSVKAGGYGTHGLSVEGDVIIDLRDMNDISISPIDIPLRRSASPMSTSASSNSNNSPPPRVPLSRFTNAFPESNIDDIYSPPDLLKRKREIDDEGDNTSSGRASPGPNPDSAPRPSTAGTTVGGGSSSSEMIRGGGTSTSSSSGSTSSHQPTRRTRARYEGPDSGASDEAMFLAAPAIPPPFQGAGAGREGSSAASSNDDAMSRSPLSTTEADDDPTPPIPATTAPSPAPRSSSLPFAPVGRPGPMPRGPFNYPSSASSSSATPVASSSRVAEPFAYGGGSAAYATHPIEPAHPWVYVTFGAGASQRMVDEYTSEHPFGGVTAVGGVADVPYYVPFAAHPVGSAVMMLGGFGFQTRLRGLSVDALVEVEMVLADGTIVVVNEHEHPDLWWAVRGAGTAFGIATRYKAKAYPIPVVYAGNIIYEFHRSTAPSLMKHFRDCIKSAPRELYANLILTAGPRASGALVVIQICWLGTKEGGAPFVNAILSWSGGSCLLNEVNEKTFRNQQDSVAKVLKAGTNRKWFLRGDVVTSLTDELIHQSVDKFAETPDGCAWLFELGAGAQVDYKDSCINPAVRAGTFNVVAFHQWKLEDIDARCVDSAEEWMRDSVNKVSAGGPVPSFSERKELVSRTIGMYGDEHWQRLVEVKRKYDPHGEIRHCFWPLDDSGRPLGLSQELLVDGALAEERGKGKPLSGSSAPQEEKGKGKEDRRHGNHFMDQFLKP